MARRKHLHAAPRSLLQTTTFIALLCSAMQAWADGASSATADTSAVPLPAMRHHGKPRIDRIVALSEALDLSPTQQIQLRKIMLEHREAVSRIWNDTEVPAPYRISATQGEGEKTSAKIRSILTEEQRKAYNAPRQEHAPDPQASRTLEEWMTSVAGH